MFTESGMCPAAKTAVDRVSFILEYTTEELILCVVRHFSKSWRVAVAVAQSLTPTHERFQSSAVRGRTKTRPDMTCRGLTSHSTLYRSFRGRFLQVRWPNQQHQSTVCGRTKTRPDMTCRGLTSHSTLYRSFRGRFLQVRWFNQQHRSTEGSQLTADIGFNPTRTTPLCYNMNCRQPLLG